MKTVFCDDHKSKIFAIVQERISNDDLVVGDDIMINGYFYRVNKYFIDIQDNEPQLLVIVHKVH